MLKLETGQVWLASLSRRPDLSYTFEIIGKVRLENGVRWVGMKWVEEELLLEFPGNQLYLFNDRGISEGDSYTGTTFTLYARSKRQARHVLESELA